jgi:phosphocarrier protein
VTERWTRSAEIVNQRGLHARASAALAREALKHDARVTLRHEGLAASAASIMDLMMLAASRGCIVEVEAEGREAAAALNAICDLIARRFDEKD